MIADTKWGCILAKWLFFGLLACALSAHAEQFNRQITIQTRGASTFYIEGHIEGYGPTHLLVDTGAGYTTINEDTFNVLDETGHASYLKELRGIMADGSLRIVPVYRISGISLGDDCYIRDVEVAVFPKKTRQILGLSALRKLSPFTLSLDEPASLTLSHCQSPTAHEAERMRILEDGEPTKVADRSFG